MRLTVRVIYHLEDEAWWAESLDVKGWSVAGESFPEVRALAVDGMRFALEHQVQLEHYVAAGWAP